MFKIESYVTPILLSYVDKYVRDFKPADAQVSLWGGGVALHNLVLKADVLQQEVALPFTLVSGRIHELLIQVPWTKIMSEPIVVTIDTIECVLSLTRPENGLSEESLPESPSRKTQVVEAPPGYMQALVRRIVSNIALRVHHLIVKYVQDDIVMSLNVKHLAVDSAGVNWEPTFADIDQAQPVIRRLMRLDDFTLCLDRADADGKIRFYQEPLLYRCQLDLRILTRLVSANTRRASSLSIQLQSSKLAWGVTGDQLTMLIRLVRERAVPADTPPVPPAKTSETQAAPLHAQSSNTAEPAHSESWTEWAWSWLPSLVDREGDVQTPAPPAPVPLHFAAYFDDVSVVFKVMETDGNNRKRSRGVLEFTATQSAFKSYVCNPTTIRMRAGMRSFALSSRGKCICGHIDYNTMMEEPTLYLRKKEIEGAEEEWTWPDDDLSQVVETAQAVDEQYRSSPELQQQSSVTPVKSASGSGRPDVGQPEQPTSAQEMNEPKDSGVEFWTEMAPQFFVEYIHERSPPEVVANPYENPPIDFQYSDWVEECEVKLHLELMEVRVCMGLIHRLSALSALFQELPPVPPPEQPMRVLTVEECDALSENLPQRRINIEVVGLHILVHPWDHSMFERPSMPPVLLDLDLPKINVAINAPLYPHRVCLAACQMPDDSGPLWQGARLHVTVNINSIQAKICSFNNVKARLCFRTDVKAVFHVLMNQEYFSKRESVLLAYSLKIGEANLCGSPARLQTAWQVPKSLWMKQVSAALKYTTLASDALNDEESVVIDMTLEDFLCRGFLTKNTTTHIITLQAAKATALHEPKGSDLKQAWLFSAPDSHTNIPYLRIAIQWCQNALPHSLEYAGLYTEPAAIAVDPLFIAWLAYRPTLKPLDALSSSGSMKSLSSQYVVRRRTTGTSSSGRGGTRSSGAEVHMRRSVGSSDKEQGRVDLRTVTKTKSMLEQLMSGDKLLALHERLQRMLVNMEIGLTLVYVTMTTASALDCATVRDAMERHASLAQDVLAFSLGRLTMFSNTLTKQFWNDIRHDGPTFIVPKQQKSQAKDSFPWKLTLADVSFYTLDVMVPPEKTGRERSGSGLRSQLRITSMAKPRTVLELVTSTVTLSVVTKQVQIKQMPKKEVVKKEKEPTPEENRLKYFRTGMDFKPTTLKEFVRGPAKRKKEKSPEPEKKEPEPVQITSGPVVSLGIHVHADTPPLIFRLEQDQVHMVTAALHCLTHIKVLLTRPPLYIPKATSSSMMGAPRSVIRSVSEMEQLQTPSDESISEKSELIPIFEALSAKDFTTDIKTFFWFQWVVSRVTIVATSWQSKLALNVDDIITSLDLQAHYNQLKIKVASASVKHYARTAEDEWTAGVLGGRVLEAREPSNAKEESHFMAITITQAQISNLPASWKEELHPKLLERKRSTDSMWELYATLAPLEAVIQPTILNQIISLVLEMAPRSFCPLAKEKETGRSDVHLPFCYVTAGGLRLLLTVQDKESNKDEDDTFVFVIGKVTVNPHPDNPICRRPINPATDTGWLNSNGALDGHQYELTIKHVGIRCAQFQQLVSQETSEAEMTKGTASENPALKWTQKIVMPNITPILHSVDISCVLAPALYIKGMLTCGPAVEFNLLSDCALEISVDQIVMAQKVMYNLTKAFREKNFQSLLLFDEEHQHTCPYATLLMSPADSDDNYNYDNTTSFSAEDMKSGNYFNRGTDSGVDCAAGSVTQETGVESTPSLFKKSVSVGFVEQWSDPSEFLELFVTMGTIELSLYTVDDGSPEVTPLRPPTKWKIATEPEPTVLVVTEEEPRPNLIEEDGSNVLSRETPGSAASRSAKSLTDTVRNVDIGKTNLEIPHNFPHARSGEGNIPLLHVTLRQPNLYYWQKTSQKSFQVSLFDAWIGLGAGCSNDYWHATLLTTESGAADPATDIPPALATMKIVSPSAAAPGNTSVRGSIRLDIERPVMLEVSLDRLQRMKGINHLMKDRLLPSLAQESFMDKIESVPEESPLLYRLKNTLVLQSIESVTVQTTQMGVTGSQGAAGWDSLSVQVAAGGRPERLVGRALVTAAVITAGPPSDSRNVVMHPAMLGAELEASWEAWRRAEGGLSALEPTVRLCLDIDCVELDLRPAELAAVTRIRDVLNEILPTDDKEDFGHKPSSSSELEHDLGTQSKVLFDERTSVSSVDATSEEHFYKDDLRSGAFKIVGGGQLPMAYQVTFHNNSVSWRYPHPRAISRLVIFPLPGQDEETPCVLELYIPILGRWEAYTRFSVPVGEPRELHLYVPAPEAVFAQMWRYRIQEYEQQLPAFQFDITRFAPRSDPMTYQYCSHEPVLTSSPACGVTAEQLSGVVRVDSCFSPRLSPRLRIVTRLASLSLCLHNSLPSLTSQDTALEGYYVSKPLWRAHRVLCLRARSATLHSRLGSPAGRLLLLDANLSSDVVECSTGTMEQLVEEFRVRGGVSLPTGALSRARVALSRVNVALHVPRLRTLQALATDWQTAVETHVYDISEEVLDTPYLSSLERYEVTEAALEGRLSLWVHNSCAGALRVGQEGTEEVVPLGPGARLAYRWRCPTAPKKLRFAIVGPSTDWQWSTSIPFTVDHFRIKLHDVEAPGSRKPAPGGGVFLYTSVEERGSRLCMRLAGRLCLANMLRFNLLYKVRARCNESNQWRTVCSGELTAETVGRTVICGSDNEMTFKIKFTGDTGWSGDIPLKECPKENVPWLVKVPCEGDLPYMSVWTRVVRARSDGRIFATVWPLYVLYSHLPLDTDVLIMTESSSEAEEPPPLVQAAPGRGASTHLMAPGTTAARHSLSFQYRNIDCPVTKEAVPLHYGMTDTSVFDKRTSVSTIEEVFADTMQWLERSERDAISDWPYSIVAKHWPGKWKPALLQPRCDVTVQYRAVRAGGGCSLEVQLRPVVILCNSAPIALTLRAHDAAPLCKLEPGTAISPPSAVLTKPFFISVEMGRETFVSGELSVTSAELGRYGAPAPGRIALDRPTEMAIQCNHKVALLTMYYEIKEEINILGITSSYILINRMDTDIMVSALAVPNDDEDQVVLRPTTYKTVRPFSPTCAYGRSLCKFWVTTRMWRGSDPAELRLYLCVALPNAPGSSRAAPIRLGQPPFRRPIALTNDTLTSVPLVVTQVKHEGRWMVTVAPDPCPQLLVHNNTRRSIGIAQPANAADEPSTSRTMIRTECSGTTWYCVIRPGGVKHYSTPSHCLRYPPPATGALPAAMPFLTFARIKDNFEPEWCAPVAAADGEQLIQLADGETVKMRLRTHPHSSNLELRDVDQHDISASDIRRRLIGAFSSEEVLESILNARSSNAPKLKRTGAEEKLLVAFDDQGSTVSSQWPSEPTTTPLANQAQQGGQAIRDVQLESGISEDTQKCDPSALLLYATNRESVDVDQLSKAAIRTNSMDSAEATSVFHGVSDNEWDETASWRASDRLRLLATSVAIQLASRADARPLVALHLDRAGIFIKSDSRRTKTTVSIADVQVDNLQYESGQYDFAVVCSTRGAPLPEEPWPTMWHAFGERRAFAARHRDARALLRLTHDAWLSAGQIYREISEVEVRLGPMALYVEDAYVTALASLCRAARSGARAPAATDVLLAEERALRVPLRLRTLLVHPLDVTLTLHTAVRMYIALDQSPLRLSAFELHDVMTSTERLTHALTVHYLSAAILGAGWVVGGLELLGAPGALAARVGGATGGVRGVASAAAAALLRSLSAWASSLARNLDLLAGDEEHARRAAAARRRPPQSFMAGLATGITNFAINILGAVGGLAHHPVVGVAVGETESGATALRRGLIGALAKPLSATADLVAYAGQGLLTQTGWDPVPQPRRSWSSAESDSGWRRDCVRWVFRLADLSAIAGYHVLLDGAPVLLLFTHKFLVLAHPDSERIVEMIDFKFCSVGPYQGQIIELLVTQRRPSRMLESRATNEDDDVQISAAAMARVARYTGAEGGPAPSMPDTRVLALLPVPGRALALHAALLASAHHNSDAHFPLL